MSLTAFTQAEQEALEDKWTWIRFQFFPGGVLGIWALATQWPNAEWPTTASWLLFAGYCFFCWTSCFHETAHQTLTGNRRTSIWLGRLLGTAMWVPYTAYRESHIRHHAYLNKPHDWELWPYSDPSTSVWFRRAFVWFDFFLGAIAAPVTYGRLYWSRKTPLDPKVLRVIGWEYVGMVAFWGVVLSAVHLADAWGGFLRGWIAPLFLAGMLQNGRKFTEHIGMASYDPMQGTRTVVGANWFTKICTYLNFDIFVHGPHHRHPRVAHRKLRELMHDYVEKAPELQYPMFRSYWRATWDMLPYLFKNPGVGMNAGAPAPHEDKILAENFVGDVVEEVLAKDDLRATKVQPS